MVNVSVYNSMTSRISRKKFSLSENVKFVLRILAILVLLLVGLLDFVLLMMAQTTPENWNIAGNFVAQILHFFHLM